jgi:hypothetical protein
VHQIRFFLPKNNGSLTAAKGKQESSAQLSFLVKKVLGR